MKTNFYGATILLSEKSDGNMKNNGENILRFLRNSGMDDVAPHVPQLEHGNNVIAISQLKPGLIPLDRPFADALITNVHGTILGVGFADCYPVFIVDEAHHAIGVAHCGWKGLKKGIIGAMIDRMILEYGTRPEKCKAFVGPGIENNCYQVDYDVYEQFHPLVNIIDRNAKFNLDLKHIITKQLGMNGVQFIQYDQDCTKCDLAASGDYKYYSGRRDKRDGTDGALSTNMAFITIL